MTTTDEGRPHGATIQSRDWPEGSTSRRRARRVLPSLVVALGLIATLGACGDAGTSGLESAAVDPPQERTSDYLITSDVLPAGWRDSNSQGIDYRVTVCGVDIEPAEPRRATSVRFSEGPVGPFLEQHVRIYDTGVVEDVVADLRRALKGCTSYEATGTSSASPTARFEVEPLTVAGAPADSVAWRQTSTTDLPITSDIVLIDRGQTAVLLMSYAVRATPDPEVLRRAVAAVDQGA